MVRENHTAVLAVLGIAWLGAVAGVSLAQAQSPPTGVSQIAGDADAGAEIYATECRGCHSVSIGPTLRGVINRPVASVASFAGYSAALKAKSPMIWTVANIDIFLTQPQEVAPGSLMVKSIPDVQQRADIIAYLASLPPPRE
ncbi:MAG TPA: c-type cytochrome [Hyphomonadaceae bacterium]|nr:c-type cytochrome [Hyphomonadaceae bacterium]